MSTRSYICRENEDGTITGSYCHCDGYLTYNGAMLLDHYSTKERVDKLLSFGNMSPDKDEKNAKKTKTENGETGSKKRTG